MARPKAKIYTNSSWTTSGDQQRQEWEKLLINSFGAELVPSAVWKFSGFNIKYCKIANVAAAAAPVSAIFLLHTHNGGYYGRRVVWRMFFRFESPER